MLLKKIAKSILPHSAKRFIIPYYKQWKIFMTLSNQYGQFQSIKKWSCVDKDGNPIPWYTYPAIEYLSNLDFCNKTILEWGGGILHYFGQNDARNLLLSKAVQSGLK